MNGHAVFSALGRSRVEIRETRVYIPTSIPR